MRDQPLRAEVVNGRLVVSIGVDALVAQVEGGDGWDQHGRAVTDADAFAGEMAKALVEEDEGGASPLSFAIDDAADWVAEDEAIGLSPVAEA